jgi:predicted ABC-type ATPase
MSEPSPNVVVIAGANGSGKSTLAPSLLRDYAFITEFVNADTIAQGLSGFDAESVAFQAGRIMLSRIRELARHRVDFGFETTLASRTFAPWLRELRETGYRCHLLFLWLASPDVAVARVQDRVAAGGHDVPEATVRRRYHAGLRNFFRLYKPIVDRWSMFDNSSPAGRTLIAAQVSDSPAQVGLQLIWNQIRGQYA